MAIKREREREKKEELVSVVIRQYGNEQAIDS